MELRVLNGAAFIVSGGAKAGRPRTDWFQQPLTSDVLDVALWKEAASATGDDAIAEAQLQSYSVSFTAFIWWPVSAKLISKMKRDLQNETASPNSKRDLQIHNYGFSEVYAFMNLEIAFRIGRCRFVLKIAFHFGDRFCTYRPPYL